MCVCVCVCLTRKDLYSLALCGHWLQVTGPQGAMHDWD